jgi:hypothetical protein
MDAFAERGSHGPPVAMFIAIAPSTINDDYTLAAQKGVILLGLCCAEHNVNRTPTEVDSRMLFLKIMMVVVALAIVVKFGLSFLVPYFRPVPALAVGIYKNEPNADMAAAAELTGRLRLKFPMGSSAAALEAELKREGWGPVGIDTINKSEHPWHYVGFKRPVSLMFVEVSSILWKSDEDGRLIDVRGGYFRDAVFKQGGWS